MTFTPEQLQWEVDWTVTFVAWAEACCKLSIHSSIILTTFLLRVMQVLDPIPAVIG